MHRLGQKFDIPEIFHSHATKKQFDKCTVCNTPLISTNQTYVIEKAIKQYSNFDKHDVIFEYALCFKCIEMLRSSMSIQSAIKMQQFFEKNIDADKRKKEIAEIQESNVESWLNTCVFTGKNRSELEEYQIVGLFQGNKIMIADMPYMISSEVGDQINEIISAQTKDEMDGFKDKFLGPPPELEELFWKKKVIVY